MAHADDSPFAKRMMERPLSPSLNVTANDRHFYDPPELIQIAFGGRPWFFETGCNRVHRVGLFKGLGWELDPVLAPQCKIEATGVRVTARQHRSAQAPTFDIWFVQRSIVRDETGTYIEGTTDQVVKVVSGVGLDDLKTTYGEVLGGHVV